tara:strand:+ start:1820 stop:2080 length:261 start_codon:yes stop_codon:yes gene_type:complete
MRIKLSNEIEACQRQRCICSKKQIPHFKKPDSKNGCTNRMCSGFERLDWGCWAIKIGSKPIQDVKELCENCKKIDDKLVIKNETKK